MHRAENIRGYPYLCIRRGSVEQIKEPACATNTTDATGQHYLASVGCSRMGPSRNKTEWEHQVSVRFALDRSVCAQRHLSGYMRDFSRKATSGLVLPSFRKAWKKSKTA